MELKKYRMKNTANITQKTIWYIDTVRNLAEDRGRRAVHSHRVGKTIISAPNASKATSCTTPNQQAKKTAVLKRAEPVTKRTPQSSHDWRSSRPPRVTEAATVIVSPRRISSGTSPDCNSGPK